MAVQYRYYNIFISFYFNTLIFIKILMTHLVILLCVFDFIIFVIFKYYNLGLINVYFNVY